MLFRSQNEKVLFDFESNKNMTFTGEDISTTLDILHNTSLVDSGTNLGKIFNFLHFFFFFSESINLIKFK